MIRYYYPGVDPGRITLYQMSEMIKDLGEIKKMESGGEQSQKDVENMTAQEKIEHYKQTGKL